MQTIFVSYKVPQSIHKKNGYNPSKNCNRNVFRPPRVNERDQFKIKDSVLIKGDVVAE